VVIGVKIKSLLLVMALITSACAGVSDNDAERDTTLTVTHGVASGDVSAHSAVIWSRTSRRGYMHVKLKGAVDGDNIRSVQVDANSDYTGKVVFDGLTPKKVYEYTVWFTETKNSHNATESETGYFQTAPSIHSKSSVTFAWGGDVAGQNVCRDKKEGFPIFAAVNELHPDFFIGLGDMIYADGVCESVGRYGNDQIAGDFIPSADIENYWAHWKYNRKDENYREMLRQTPYIAIWDDHEVVNDFGPLHDTRDAEPYTPEEHLLPIGLSAFLDYNPLAESVLTPGRLYRNLRWGQHLEMFILDTRQYRDANLKEDDKRWVKTLLGREQLTWLKEKLKASDATWKVVVSSVPISIPTGFPVENGRDGWANYDQATGFENELRDLLKYIYDVGERNLLFITTDVHFAEMFRYTPFPEDPGFKVYEGVTGPMNAGLFPNRNYDQTFAPERLFFYGPDSSSVADYQEARRWLNFGVVEIDGQGRLTLSVVDVDGNRVYQNRLTPQETAYRPGAGAPVISFQP
jgi:alkaline phosphatase D